jgi:hypothetical protein
MQPPGAWEGPGSLHLPSHRPHSLPACVARGPWCLTERLKVGLGRVFSLLGRLPIVPQQTLKVHHWEKSEREAAMGTEPMAPSLAADPQPSPAGP